MERREDFRFPRSGRLQRRRQFEQLLRGGRRVVDRRLTVWALPNGLGYSRLGLIVGRKHGRAIRRNRIKRLLREAFRLSRPELPEGLDIICTPRVGANIRLPEAIESLQRVTRRLVRAFEHESR